MSVVEQVRSMYGRPQQKLPYVVIKMPQGHPVPSAKAGLMKP